MVDGQISIWDVLPEKELKPGDWVEEHGPPIPHCMRPLFIGKLVVLDKSTVSHKWYQVGRLKKYVEGDNGGMRSIVDIGEKREHLNYIDHALNPSIYHTEIYELSPKEWDSSNHRWVPKIRKEI